MLELSSRFGGGGGSFSRRNRLNNLKITNCLQLSGQRHLLNSETGESFLGAFAFVMAAGPLGRRRNEAFGYHLTAGELWRRGERSSHIIGALGQLLLSSVWQHPP
jgi:hypothetical protein